MGGRREKCGVVVEEHINYWATVVGDRSNPSADCMQDGGGGIPQDYPTNEVRKLKYLSTQSLRV